MAGISLTQSIALKAPAPGKTYPTLYVAGTVDGDKGLFRSVDQGANWQRLTQYPGGILSSLISIDADKTVFGKVYLATTTMG